MNPEQPFLRTSETADVPHLPRLIVWFLFSIGIALQAAEELPSLTPKPRPAPHLNTPALYGARPGHPFLYRIPCTGKRPMNFSADSLPPGLTLDRTTGIIRGHSPVQPGRYSILLRARNTYGSAKQKFTLIVGERIALTPPLGWNDWYTHYDHITDNLVRKAADVMVDSGMADFGYQYVNIDDCWMMKPGSSDPDLGGPPRTDRGVIRPNRRFPDMRALTDYIHAKGLRTGIYTSPGPRTCAGFEGSYEHEAADARQFADWGFDFLKYDWCSYGKVVRGTGRHYFESPYQIMGDILARLDRDIVFNLCQYGMGDVWTWGAAVGGQCWRTTSDLGLEKNSRLPGFYSIAFTNAVHAANAGPGGWNDPDYILIGAYGDPRQMGRLQKTTLTPQEQYSYMSLWTMMAAPLFFSGDMSQLDNFTLNVLCNSEVIAVDQDAFGQQARIVRNTDQEYILERVLSDGSVAVGLFNLDLQNRPLSVDWSALGLSGTYKMRDLWRQRDLGLVNDRLEERVPGHGVFLFRLWRAKNSAGH